MTTCTTNMSSKNDLPVQGTLVILTNMQCYSIPKHGSPYQEGDQKRDLIQQTLVSVSKVKVWSWTEELAAGTTD